MISKDFFLALEDLEREKGVSKEVFIQELENALACACKKQLGEATNVEVKLNSEKYTIRVYSYKNIVEVVEDPDKEISLEEAQEIKKSYEIGGRVAKEISPKEFSRVAAQTAKQVIMQKLKEIEKNQTLDQYSEKENEMLVGIVNRTKEDGTVYVEIGKNQMEGILMPNDQIPGEKFKFGDKIKVYVKRVREFGKGVQVVLSRSCADFVKRLFESEVPEIRAGLVVIKSIAREAGYRTKIAVYSTDADIDAVGACVGAKGVRINAISNNELHGEKIDVIPWNENNFDFVANALSPAKVLMVQGNEDKKEATVVVPDDKLSLAIGREGQNARLAARLTGWKIDVKSYSNAVKLGLVEGEGEQAEDEKSAEDLLAEINSIIAE
ncbi:MAG: transcription termination/antitermination protein NusA [Clostridia bacterium]|nr:transcription termination/antitermination protein NusA [Clostridia bacterium]